MAGIWRSYNDEGLQLTTLSPSDTAIISLPCHQLMG